MEIKTLKMRFKFEKNEKNEKRFIDATTPTSASTCDAKLIAEMLFGRPHWWSERERERERERESRNRERGIKRGRNL